MDLDTAQLRALVAVIDSGTFTDAAIDLGVSQAAVSRRVRALEQTLSTQLLRRTTHAVELTTSGHRLLPHARNILGELAVLARLSDVDQNTVRIGYAWAALGRHTVPAQRAWATEHPGGKLHFIQSNTPSAGLAEGAAAIAVLRRDVTDHRFETVQVGREDRYVAVAADDPLARRRAIRLADLADRVIGIDTRTGTTSPELWQSQTESMRFQNTASLDEWLTLISAGDAVGVTSVATTVQHPRSGVAYRRLKDAEPIAVLLAWWKDDRHPQAAELTRLFRRLYASG